MALIYDLDELSRSGLDAMQTTQRDWSPYLVHFTSRRDMDSVRKLLDNTEIRKRQLAKRLALADKKSFGVFSRIIREGSIHASPTKIMTMQPVAVCLSECTLSGVISHSERLGRFGIMFNKSDVYNDGGWPRAYLDREVCDEIERQLSASPVPVVAGALNGFINPFSPAKSQRRVIEHRPIQDFTIEREWRIRNDYPIKKLCGGLCPRRYFAEVLSVLEEGVKSKVLWSMVPVFPIDVLYQWGV